MALPVGNLSVLWDESVTGESTTIIAMQLQCIGSSEIATGYKSNCHHVDHHQHPWWDICHARQSQGGLITGQSLAWAAPAYHHLLRPRSCAEYDRLWESYRLWEFDRLWDLGCSEMISGNLIVYGNLIVPGSLSSYKTLWLIEQYRRI